MERVIRWSVHEILERWEHLEATLRNKLKVAVSHIIHEVDVKHIADDCYERALSHQYGSEYRNGKQKKIKDVLCERMDHRCDRLCDN